MLIFFPLVYNDSNNMINNHDLHYFLQFSENGTFGNNSVSNNSTSANVNSNNSAPSAVDLNSNENPAPQKQPSTASNQVSNTNSSNGPQQSAKPQRDRERRGGGGGSSRVPSSKKAINPTSTVELSKATQQPPATPATAPVTEKLINGSS